MTSPVSPAAPGAVELRWRHVFPGDKRQLQVLRRWLAGLLPECAARDDVVSAAVELSTNAVQFSRSGRGGWFAVEITWSGQGVRVAVADGGAPTGPRLVDDPAGEHGRGLLMVRALSVRTGVSGDERGRLVWAEIPWTGEGAAEPGSFPAGYEAAIREDQATLAERFAGVPIWFGRATLQWWALPGQAGGRLLTAPSAREMAWLLDRVLRPPPGPGRMAADEPGVVRAGERVRVPAVHVAPGIHWTRSRFPRLGIQPC
jgi:serine/threonine-protein kinase RsbW